MAGRPRKPTQLKVVAGTAQRCRTNRNEPKPARGVPPPPKHLSARARAAWAPLAAIVDDMGVLTKGDPVALEGLCSTYVAWQEARESLARPLVYTTKGGEAFEMAAAGERYYWTVGMSGPMRRVRPEVADIADAERRLAMWLAKFGLTPADRSRVSAAPPKGSNAFAGLG